MNKQELIGQVADRAGLSRNDAARAVETMLEVVTATLKRGDEVRWSASAPFRFSAQGLDRPQPAHRRADADQGQHPAQVQAGQGPEGRGSVRFTAADGAGVWTAPKAPLWALRPGHGRVAQW